jgi:hypothetical protein
MTKLKAYFANLWAAILGRGVTTQGGCGSGEEKPK